MVGLVERIRGAVVAFRGLSEKPVGDMQVLGFKEGDTVLLRMPDKYLKGGGNQQYFKYLHERIKDQGAVLYILPDSWKFSILRARANMNGLEAAKDMAAEYEQDSDKI